MPNALEDVFQEEEMSCVLRMKGKNKDFCTDMFDNVRLNNRINYTCLRSKRK